MSLVITRRECESVVLYTQAGEQIIITMEGQESGQCKLSFVAPSSVTILREELMDLTLDQFMRRSLAQ